MTLSKDRTKNPDIPFRLYVSPDRSVGWGLGWVFVVCLLVGWFVGFCFWFGLVWFGLVLACQVNELLMN